MNNGTHPTDFDLDRAPEAGFVELFRRTSPAFTLDIERLVTERGPIKSPSRSSVWPHRGSWWAWAATPALISSLAALAWMWFSVPTILLAQVGAELRQVTSYRCSMTQTMKRGHASKTDKSLSAVNYWAAPRSYRHDVLREGKLVSSSIRPADKPGIEIDYVRKTFERVPAVHASVSAIMILGKLASFGGIADRELGKSKTGGVDVQGFEVSMHKIDANLPAGDKLRVWADVKTKLPVAVEMEMMTGTSQMRITDFVWNESPEKWFDTTPPSGFRETRPQFPTPKPAEMAKKIADALRTYAKYDHGHYPRVKRIYGDTVMWELRKAAGINLLGPRTKKITKEQQQALGECGEASWGLAYMTQTQRDNADTAYNGLTVGPADKGKVLFRWKLDTDDYMVIYGDLRHETVTRQRLKQLEGE